MARGAAALAGGRRAGGRDAGRAGAAPGRARRQLLHAHSVDHTPHCTPPCGLRAEYSAWLLLGYVHYCAGRSQAWPRAGALAWPRVRPSRAQAACVLHAHVVSPALAAAVVSTFTDGVDYRIAQGVMLWSRGGGCAWLAAALGARDAAACCAALYVASLLTAPLHSWLLCGRVALPPLAGVVCTLCTVAGPFAVGLLVSGARGPARGGPGRGVQLAALALLYAECCERLCDAEAIVYLGDVLAAFVLELCCVCVSAAWCCVYWRGGLLAPAEARLVAQCALPRWLDTRWGAECAAPGLCRLPGVFVAPTQTLLLAALGRDCDGCDGGDGGDGCDGCEERAAVSSTS